MVVTNQQLYEKLGELTAGQRHATESREVMHDRMDKHEVLLNETVNTLSKVQFAAEVTASLVSQLRDQTQKLGNEIQETIKPALQTSKTFQEEVQPFVGLLRNIRLGIWVLTGVLSVGGVTTFGALAFFGDLVKGAVAHWLGVQLN